MNTTAERLCFLIDTLSIKKRDFAASIDISTGNLSDWCSGRSKPSHNALNKIEEVYGISSKWLIDGVGEMYVSQSETRNDEYLSTREQHIIEMFRLLSYEDQLKIEGILEYKTAEISNEEEKSSLSPNQESENKQANLLA